ncbi:hypothetical protein AW736_17900 [Termitidicoccus mucosus]|uniref:Integrase n=2 Tax=Termitidicoccus mucosus TaxID=1184151 RepID=A0A178IF57_9BACT|nr:hypothetical protein AW736_17850 [Opitutaceae bacterium TSB47]OAM88261.1 hypothetical protein AW736_17900 [Opitutaceae bacterium TSB47]
MKPDPFASLIKRFFADFLPVQRNLSAHTVSSYRDTFRLLLQFISEHYRTSIDALGMEHFSPETTLAFLDHLERSRGNTVRTRNNRLAALRSFARFALAESAPDFLPAAQRLLSIPVKKTDKPQMGFLTREEVTAILSATGDTAAGQRDHLLFTVLYNTGARISEALALRPQDIRGRSLQLHGKGRKTRLVPLWPQTLRRLRRWCQIHALRPDQPVFTNTRGAPLGRSGAAFRLALAVRKAAAQHCHSLRSRNITLHTFRHTTAMHLLQSGVPLEVIALWLGHERPFTTHLYVEADIKLKADCLRRLQPLTPPVCTRQRRGSHLLAFLEAL